MKKKMKRFEQELKQLDYTQLIELADLLEDEIERRSYEEDYPEEEIQRSL